MNTLVADVTVESNKTTNSKNLLIKFEAKHNECTIKCVLVIETNSEIPMSQLLNDVLGECVRLYKEMHL